MNLTELQVELRSMEDHIRLLHTEIEKMKPQTEEEKEINFDAITELAKKYPIRNEKISSAPMDIKKLFVAGLSYVMLSAKKDMDSRLLYLCRFSIGCGFAASAEYIYKIGLEFERKDIEKLCMELVDYKYAYLTEAFIIANISEEAPRELLKLLSDIATLMACDQEEIRVIAQVAKSRLIGDINIIKEIPFPSKNRWSGKFTDYIPHEWIVEQRKCCGEICIKSKLVGSMGLSGLFHARDGNNDGRTIYPCAVKSRLQAGSLVQEGDSLLVYDRKIESQSTLGFFGHILQEEEKAQIGDSRKEGVMSAPCNGIVFFVEREKQSEVRGITKTDKYLAVYVVSYFDEYNDFCAWYKE